MEMMIFKHITDWTYHPDKGIVCTRCKTQIKISEANIQAWNGSCSGCAYVRKYNLISAFVIGLLIAYIGFKLMGWM